MNMRFFKTALVLVALVGQGIVLTACTQFPTEKSQVVDLRPQISFKISNPSPEVLTARVLVNGLDGGAVGSYIEGQGALRILPGSNRIRVMSESRAVIDEQVYLGDGVSRSFVIN